MTFVALVITICVILSLLPVTELETRVGIFKAEAPGKTCTCFARHLEGIQDHLDDPLTVKFTGGSHFILSIIAIKLWPL